jgi:DNA-binding transcriptional LysR family regulator
MEWRVDLRRLEVFCRVVEMKSFTKAAEAVFLSQPTVSDHIRTLEEMVGEKLLDRLGREVLPTKAGELLYTHALRILKECDEAIQAIEEYRGNISGHLFLGASTIPGTYILPSIAASFKNRFPDIQLTIRISSSHVIASQMNAGELELGIIGARWNDTSLEWEQIFSDELVLAVHPSHPWSGRDSITLEELTREPFIHREVDSGTRKVMTQIMKIHGYDARALRIVAEMGSTEAVKQCIKQKIGISILSRQAVTDDLEHGSLAFVPVEGIRFIRPFYLITRKNRQSSPVCTAFLEHLRTFPLNNE